MNIYLHQRTQKMHFKSLSATVVGLALLVTPGVVPAFAQEQVNPTPAQEQVTPTPTQEDATPSQEQGEGISTPTQENATPSQEQGEGISTPTQEGATSSDDTSTISDETAKTELSASEAAIEQLVNEDIIEEVPLRQLQFKSAPRNFREHALKQAISQVGYKEESSNCNKFSRYFNKDCHSWCADFVSWAFDSTGNRNKRVDWGNPSLVASILHWGKTKPNQARLVKIPQPGDIFLIKTKTASHTGLVRSVSGTTFTTVEGNASNKVRSVKRSLNKYVFVRVLRSQ